MEQNKQAPTLYVRYDVVYNDGSRQHGWAEVPQGATVAEMEMAAVQDIDGWYGTACGGVKAHYAEHGHLFDIPPPHQARRSTPPSTDRLPIRWG